MEGLNAAEIETYTSVVSIRNFNFCFKTVLSCIYLSEVLFLYYNN